MIDSLTNVSSLNAFEAKLLTCKSPKLFLVDIKQFKNINLEFGDEGGKFRIVRVFDDATKLCKSQRDGAFSHTR
ncbi:hypothetical protein [Sulfurospirillum multivorans]|uniref:Diguanylate cyclase/phosphodiesterase (GGDEF & EAL domains) with PAS/PAC sensor(S) n=2 Tax=Sulfurospirillum multivorans TaxID=66821 RepID=A0AA86ARI6_SULMK|nr:hypothetical protein [Sulfurospirillum multivorans]AHJ14456.1 diguanylate cyclase/phosphodiesterase (GGDEF & EAL domains) with PAS/PAC sensor(s) [Sulfurospirillum multivorans DSM 12446]QEH07941.1 diguanylate cyclase/phosphodiesterase (GGDEF & EAL domains) with PAS/PAC sensor(s) [Sulfurospirillum multivorans]